MIRPRRSRQGGGRRGKGVEEEAERPGLSELNQEKEMEITPTLFAVIAIIALICEYMDASIGMGYGTALSPILIIMGFLPLQVVPAVLLGQLVGGLAGGFFHHRVGNISLDFRRDEAIKGRLRRLGYLPRSVDSKVIFILKRLKPKPDDNNQFYNCSS